MRKCAGGSRAPRTLMLQSHHGAVDVTGRQFEYDYKTDTFVVTGDAVVNQAATSSPAIGST